MSAFCLTLRSGGLGGSGALGVLLLSSRVLRWALLLFMSAAGAASVPVAAAQPSDDHEARALYEAGAAAFADGRFVRALDRFREAYELTGRPELLYNVGECHDRLRQDAEAIAAFEAYLAAQPEAFNRRQVEVRLVALREAVLRASGAPDPTLVEARSSQAAAGPTPADGPASAGPTPAAATTADESSEGTRADAFSSAGDGASGAATPRRRRRALLIGAAVVVAVAGAAVGGWLLLRDTSGSFTPADIGPIAARVRW